MGGIAAQVYVIRCAFFHGEGAKSRFYGFPIARIGVLYLALQLVLGLVFTALGTLLPVWVPVVLYAVLMGASVIGFVAAQATREEIHRQDGQLKKDVSLMRALQSKLVSLSGAVQEEAAAAALAKLSDELRYSDPVSSEALAAIEADLAACIDEIDQAIVEEDPAAVVTIAKKASSVLSERNRLCKLNKG